MSQKGWSACRNQGSREEMLSRCMSSAFTLIYDSVAIFTIITRLKNKIIALVRKMMTIVECHRVFYKNNDKHLICYRMQFVSDGVM